MIDRACISLNNNCNLRCRYCHFQDKQHDFISFGLPQLIQIVDNIHNYCKGKIMDSYGIGTFLTCDVLDCKPMNIVVKLIRGRITESREWHPCVKLSCDKGKTLGDKAKCDYLLSVLDR